MDLIYVLLQSVQNMCHWHIVSYAAGVKCREHPFDYLTVEIKQSEFSVSGQGKIV